MAQPDRRLDTNVPGDFYVDSSCIDCEACRWIAPASFQARGLYSRVYHQPTTRAEQLRAEMALLACPTGSIGAEHKPDLTGAMAAFPESLAGNVYHCGYHARASFGAASYLIVRPQGNILIDSPRFAAPLVRRLETLGGVRLMFLTHADDVADHQKFHDHFGCDRLLHVRDARSSVRIEHPLQGDDPVPVDDEVLLLPTPGHTEGSICLLYRNTFLFSGDHLAWDPETSRVIAFHDACWYSWEVQQASMRRLAEYRFEWILPGHGWRCHFPAEQMAAKLRECLEWMGRMG